MAVASAPASELKSSATEAKKARGVTLRVMLLSLFLAAMFGYIVPTVDYRFNNTFLGAVHLPAGAVAVLLAIVLVINPLLKLASRRFAMSRNETLTVYITCLFSVLVPGRGGENFFIPNVLSSFYYASKENKWLEFLLPYVKPWITPAISADGQFQKGVADGWFESIPATQSIPWDAWLVPLGAWTAIIFALYTMLGCLGVMVRAQWAEREALAFPLLQLPLRMTEDMDKPGGEAGSFFRNPTMWVGFSIAVFVQMLNGLHLYFPDVPELPLAIPTGALFTEAPWNQIGRFELQVWPVAVGIAFLLTSEISFSFWAFFLSHKFQLVAAYYLGYAPASMPDPVWTRFTESFIGYQQLGAIVAYSLSVIWLGREHGTHIFRRAIGRERAQPSEANEALSYPVAFWGFLLSWSFVIAWTAEAGVRLDIAVVMWVSYLIVAIGLTRIVVEAGLLMVHTGWIPLGPIAGLMPKGWIPPSSVVPSSFIGGALMWELRGFLLPSFVQSFKLAHDRKIAARPLMGLIAACVVVSFAVAMWTIIRMGYDYGGLTLQKWWANGPGGQGPALNSAQMIKDAQEDLLVNWGWTAVGAVTALLLITARAHFSWFPLHPLGYIIFAPFAIATMSFSIFLGWLAKTLIMKFGGTPAYRAALPGFLGLALGDVTMMVFWVIIDGWQGRTGHFLMPS